MNYGLYLSASGVMTNLHRQDVIANNLANASTTGFKREMVAFQQRDAEAVENLLDPQVSNQLLDRLGGGAFVNRSVFDFTSGALIETENDLDVAIDGPGFFVLGVDTPEGQKLQLSRDGRFTINMNGQLVTTAGGHVVTDMSGQPVIVDRSLPVVIDNVGNVLQQGDAVGRIRIATAADTDRLIPLGEGLYDWQGTTLLPGDATQTQINQGYIEQSNVEPVTSMVQMIQTTRSINYNTQLIKYHDAILDRAVNTLGRVS